MAEGCDKLNELLKHGILADANHDFKEKGFGLSKEGVVETILKGTDESICSDIPERSSNGEVTYYDEDNLLYKLLDEKNNFDDRRNFNEQLIEKLVKSEDYKIELTGVGYEDNTYNVSLLHYYEEIDLKSLIKDPHITESDIRDFFDDRDYRDQNILIDTGTIDFLNFFHVKNYNINFIINREKINDPARSSKILGKIKGITYLLDIDKSGEDGDICYHYNEQELNRDKFFSRYYFYLGPPTKIEPQKSNSKLKTRFLIMPDDGEEFEDYETINSDDNNIENCVTALKTRPEEDWPMIYQRKRAGDWLMVLSCFDTRREYLNEETEDKFNLKKTVIKTIDRILLWYALLLGADVLYEARGSLIFFRNANRKEKAMAQAPHSVSVPAPVPRVIPCAEREPATVYNGKWNVCANIFFNDLPKSKQKILRDAGLFKWYQQRGHRSNILPEDDIDNVELTINNGKKFSLGELSKLEKHGFISKSTYDKIISQVGGSANPSKKLCNDYLTELSSDIECFDSEENPDYNYYEKTAFIVLSCLNEYRTSANFYEQIQAILFDILPSIEGYIKCKEPEIQQFFGGDDYTADCTAYAARNIALHSLGLRTGKIESLGNREKHSVKIPPSAVEFYKKTDKHLEQSTFEERKEWIIDQLQAYHRFMHPSAKRASATRKAKASASRKSRASASRKLSAKAISVGGSKTRRKSRK
jgi:hypothetical protein